MREKYITNYVEGRDEALKACLEQDSIEPFKVFLSKQRLEGLLPECFTQVPDSVLEISVRKMSLYSLNIPVELKGQAVNWLLERGYDLQI